MNSVSNSPDRVRITEFFAELNSCWQQGKLDELHLLGCYICDVPAEH